MIKNISSVQRQNHESAFLGILTLMCHFTCSVPLLTASIQILHLLPKSFKYHFLLQIITCVSKTLKPFFSKLQFFRFVVLALCPRYVNCGIKDFFALKLKLAKSYFKIFHKTKKYDYAIIYFKVLQFIFIDCRIYWTAAIYHSMTNFVSLNTKLNSKITKKKKKYIETLQI